MKRVSRLAFSAAVGLVFALTLAAVTFAQTPAPPKPGATPLPIAIPVASLTIDGTITNQTPGGTLPVTMTVMLYGYDRKAPTLQMAATSDSKGKVRFEDVANKPGRSFGLVATVGRTTYGGDLRSPNPGTTEMTATLKIFDTTTDTSQMRVTGMFVLGEFLSEKELQVVNAYFLSNRGDRAVEDGERAADGQTGTLRFALPTAATDVQFQGESADRFIRTDDGFLTTWGIPPGENVGRVIVSYSLPYTGQMRLELPVGYPVEAEKVLLVDQGVTLASPHLKDKGTDQRQDGERLRVYEGEALPANQPLILDLSGRPKVTHVDPGEASMQLIESASASRGLVLDLRQRIGLGIVAFGLMLLAAGAVWWVWSKRRASADADSGLSPKHKALIQVLASLDEAHDAGKIDEEDYARQRPVLKGALLRVLETGPDPST